MCDAYYVDLRFFTTFKMTDDIAFLAEASMSIVLSRKHEAPDRKARRLPSGVNSGVI